MKEPKTLVERIIAENKRDRITAINVDAARKLAALEKELASLSRILNR